MKYVFVLLFAVIAVSFVVGEDVYSQSDINEWNNYKATHSKTYDDAEDKRRMKIYIQSRDQVAEHNRKFEKGEVLFKQAINQFSDQLPEEVNRGGFKRT